MSRKRYSVPAWKGKTAVSLADVLAGIGTDEVIQRQWTIHDVEVAGNPRAASEFRELAQRQDPIAGERLVHLTTAGAQVINGVIVGHLKAAEHDLLIEAIDSSHWDVEGEEQTLHAFKEAFPEAVDVPL